MVIVESEQNSTSSKFDGGGVGVEGSISINWAPERFHLQASGAIGPLLSMDISNLTTYIHTLSEQMFA